MMTKVAFEVPRPLPDGMPMIEPAEAIAIGISLQALRPVNPQGNMVRVILDALRLAGWEIVPASGPKRETKCQS